jgi:ABC-type glycerol-3-phosphate transport system substrate-binding protein
MKWSKVKAMSCSLTAVMMLSALAGCGEQATTAGETGADTAKEPATVAESKEATDSTAEAKSESDECTITVSIQTGTGVEEGWQAVADAYTAMHPNVKVVLDLKATDGYDQWVQNVFASTDTTSVDIVNINLAGDAKTGKSINYNDYIDNDSPYSDGTWKEQFEYGKQVINMADNSFDALSLDSVQVLWLYNQDIFDEVGVSVPKTWDELIEVSEKIQAAGYQPIAMPGDYNSFYSGTMGWLSQIYADQTTRSMIEVFKAQPGDYCYDPDIDGHFKYDPTDCFNDDSDKVTQNPVRAFLAIKDGTYAPDSEGMKTVWTNFAKIFPKYAGGDAMFGTDSNGAKALFYQGKAAMMINGGWGITMFMNDMKALEAGEEVKDSAGNVISDIKAFTLGTFNMPSMEGAGIEAPARTIEVANGFLGCVSKDQAHNDQVVDFLMYFSSEKGMSVYLNAAIAAGACPSGASLVYGVEYPQEIQNAFAGLTFIGNAQKGFNNTLSRGIGESAETFRNFYDYSYQYLTGAISIDDWASAHKKNVMDNLPNAMAEKGISDKDLENPANEPTGE